MSKIISEIFYSIQGEGPTVGNPAVFVRFSGCNLKCCWCDSQGVMKHPRYTLEEAIEYLKGVYDPKVSISPPILIFTGGEPLLYLEEIPLIINAIKKVNPGFFKIEIETNGTMSPLDGIFNRDINYNVSPKLPSSLAINYYKPDIIKEFFDLKDYNCLIFKFVIETQKDIDDMHDMYVTNKIVPKNRIYLMPKGANREELHKNYPIVAEFAKYYNYKLSPRLQIDIWDDKKGV